MRNTEESWFLLTQWATPILAYRAMATCGKSGSPRKAVSRANVRLDLPKACDKKTPPPRARFTIFFRTYFRQPQLRAAPSPAPTMEEGTNFAKEPEAMRRAFIIDAVRTPIGRAHP